MVARFGQAVRQNGGVPDLFGEETLLEAWRGWATRYAGEAHATDDQRRRLAAMAFTTGEADARWCVAFGWEAYGGAARGGTRPPITPLGDASPITDREGSPKSGGSAPIGDEEEQEAEDEDEPADEGKDEHLRAEPVGLDYVLSVSTKRGLRTLHRVGWCFRIPGIHYRDYEVLGAALPEGAIFHRCCRNCWPGPEGGPAREEDPVLADGELSPEAGGSTSSSSSSDELGA